MPRHSSLHGLSGHSKKVLGLVASVQGDKVVSPAREAVLHTSVAAAEIKKHHKNRAKKNISSAQNFEKKAAQKSASRGDPPKVTKALSGAVKTLGHTASLYKSKSPAKKLVSATNEANTETRQAYHAVLADTTGSPIGHSKKAKAKRSKSKSPGGSSPKKSPKVPRKLSKYNLHMSSCLKGLSSSSMTQKEKFSKCVEGWSPKKT